MHKKLVASICLMSLIAVPACGGKKKTSTKKMKNIEIKTEEPKKELVQLDQMVQESDFEVLALNEDVLEAETQVAFVEQVEVVETVVS